LPLTVAHADQLLASFDVRVRNATLVPVGAVPAEFNAFHVTVCPASNAHETNEPFVAY
jgi:hypothetical protein